MTKLFTMRTLAFAGAAAFALTLAAAPQAEAATKTKPLFAQVDYVNGQVIINENNSSEYADADSPDYITTADGESLYYGQGKDESKIKKYYLIADNDTSMGGFQFDISNLLGKESVLKFTTDSTGIAGVSTTVKLAAAPTLKASLSGDEIKVTINGSEQANTIGSGKLKGYYFQYKFGTYGQWSRSYKETEEGPSFKEAIKAARDFGTTVYVRVASMKTTSDGSDEQASPWSKEVKVKVSAKAKAPKIAIKTANLKKAFSWKMGNKVEYRLTVNDKTTYWTDGSTEDADLSKIFSAAVAATKSSSEETIADKLDATDNQNSKLIMGDAIADSMQIQVRTKGDDAKGKVASNITVLNLDASINSPASDQIIVRPVNAKKKTDTASGAAITPANVGNNRKAQYSVDEGKTWKTLNKSIELSYDKLGSNGTLQLRLINTDKKTTVLPSAVTTVTIPKNATNPDKDDKANPITYVRNVIDNKTWKQVTSVDDNNQSASKDYADSKASDYTTTTTP